MKSDEIRLAIRDFLSFVERPCAEPDGTLALLLDKLALASHFADIHGPIVPNESETGETIQGDQDAIAARFPDYGMFEVAFPFSRQPGDTKLCVINAIDALHDIYLELSRVESVWGTLSTQHALTLYRFSFDSHWHWHLRELQLYLHARAGAQ